MFNEKLSKEEYQEKLQKIVRELTPEKIIEYAKQLEEISLKIPRKHMRGSKNENVTGDYNDNCGNLKDCFDCINNEKSAYTDSSHQSFDLCDCSYNIMCSLCYEVNGGANYNNCKFIYYGRNLQDCEYCQYCFSGKHLFGCVGLRNKEYCIFNKQYAEKDYFEMRKKIIEYATKTNEYGEFFPAPSSPFPFDESVASYFFPILNNKL